MALTVVRGASASNGMPPALSGRRRSAANGTKRLATIWEDLSEWDDVSCRTTKSSKQSAPLSWPLGLEQPLQLTDNAAAESFIKCLKSSCQSHHPDVHAWLRGASVALALTEHGVRALIATINVATGADRARIASDLKGHVVALCMSPHGHKVLLHLIENMTANAIPFIADEMCGQSAKVAKDKFGYQVVESMIMHYPQSCIAQISMEIANTTEELCRDLVGHIVLQRILEYGPQSGQALVLRRLTNDLPLLVMNYAASRVVEKAIECLGETNRRTIVHALLQPCRQACLADVACSRCGSSLLIQLATANVCTDELRPQLLCSVSRLGKSKYGLKVLSAFGMTAEGKGVHK